MAKLFSVASWNVEHFKGDGPDSARVDRVVAFLAEQRRRPLDELCRRLELNTDQVYGRW